jgi:FecR protein
MKAQNTIALLAFAGAVLITATAQAQQVGTATAVNPESRTTPPGGATTVLAVGAHVVHKEHIKTTSTGSVQLLFLDRSTLTIAPNSDIVIDEFVYNPGTGSGHMAVSLAKGAMKVVGGQLSHAGAATVNAGNATIGIRGGTGIFTTKEAINLNGTLTPNNCPPVKRPGYKMPLGCGPIQQASAGELSHYINLFTSKPGQNGGVAGLTNAKLNALGLTSGWHPATPTTLPTGTDPNNVLVQAVQHGTLPGQFVPPTLPPPISGSGVRVR